jgi:hypothetical protein
MASPGKKLLIVARVVSDTEPAANHIGDAKRAASWARDAFPVDAVDDTLDRRLSTLITDAHACGVRRVELVIVLPN